MLLEDFDYELPGELIASEPLADRAASRVLHLDRAKGLLSDKQFVDLPTLLREGDVLVFNNTRVFPARLVGRTETGGTVELLLEEELDGGGVWSALAKPAKRLRPGKKISFSDGFTCEVVERINDGHFRIVFQTDDVWSAAEAVGHVPLPHYIKRPESDADRERYQTIFARERGAIAAPTAGLHFTETILDSIRAAGVELVELTLHVGYGTFEPVRAEDLSKHQVLPERFEISESSAKQLNDARKEGRRIVAVGTTTTRALESALGETSEFKPQRTRTNLTITPGYCFRAVDAMLTNFHLPKSSLLILVSTFGGHEFIMEAYRHAVRSRYRFYSYGDCMFIE
ncbi:MAG: tRNA preQ1(34) S-adenosylmethionine ribosyltransferase-isomerase QueA [Pyrinomonadaceae bacterium]